MAYDPNPLGPAQAGRDEMPVIIGAGSGAPEQLLIVGRPRDGRVTVREWSGADWSAAPRVRALAADALYDEIERAERAGRRVNQGLYAVRLWLSGAAR